MQKLLSRWSMAVLDSEDGWPWVSWRAGYLYHCQRTRLTGTSRLAPVHSCFLLALWQKSCEVPRKMWAGAGCCQRNSAEPQPVPSWGSPAVVLTAAALAFHGNRQGCPWKALDLLLMHWVAVLRHTTRFGYVRERRSWHAAHLFPRRREPACHGEMLASTLWRAACRGDALWKVVGWAVRQEMPLHPVLQVSEERRFGQGHSTAAGSPFRL